MINQTKFTYNFYKINLFRKLRIHEISLILEYLDFGEIL